MQTFSLKVENKTADRQYVVLFGTAGYLQEKMTISGTDVEILSTCKKTYQEMIDIWDKLGIVNRYEVVCANPETIVEGKDYSHYVKTTNANLMFARKTLNYNTIQNPGFVCKTLGGIFMTDNAVQLFFELSPYMKLEISMDFEPRNSKP